MALRQSSFKNLPQRQRLATWLMGLCLIYGIGLPLLLSPSQAQAQAQTPKPTKKSNAPSKQAPEPVTLNFNNAEIDAVAKTLATLSGHNVVVDPRVKGTINLTSNVPVAPSQALRLFAAQLRTQGFALVESAGLYLVVPEADAKLQSGGVSAGTVPTSNGQIVTQIFQLNHENANNLVPILRPLISPNNTVNVNPGTNALVITDYADNLQRLGRIIAALDVANATGVEVIALKHALATDVVPMLQRLLDSGAASGAAPAPGQSDTALKTTVMAEARSNSLIVRAANAARMALARSLVVQLDQPAASGPNAASGNIHVVYLKNADATKLAATLRAALSAQSGPGSSNTPVTTTSMPNNPGTSASGANASFGATGGQVSTGGQIQADPSTNSLIITAPEPQYRQLRAVIDKLDARRAQVFVESLIAEVSAEKAAEFGVQWQGPVGGKGDTNIGLLGTNFKVGGANLIALAAQGASGNVAPSSGLNVGVAHNTNGTYVLGFLARFLQTTGDGNVLSTPNLLTLDNEEAKIVIGQNVPFVTGQYTNNNTNSGAVNPFQTIERKDVGLTLRVKPQISENGTVKLQIYQEVSRLDPASINSSTGLITNKRSIESSVLVEDGAIVVLGGLLQDDYGNSQERVPGLSDVPVFGNLFRAESRSRKKTNLMVFLRPVVVRDGAATGGLSLDRYEQMRGAQTQAQPGTSPGLPAMGAPILPEPTRKP
ncbi:MAG: type II secretion system secretin GspD [Comamonadaceae bacterium]|jgi:general secretion pathway protein D|nr:type II secretion system secretin GspD [Comamonadaceae bacterium]